MTWTLTARIAEAQNASGGGAVGQEALQRARCGGFENREVFHPEAFLREARLGLPAAPAIGSCRVVPCRRARNLCHCTAELEREGQEMEIGSRAKSPKGVQMNGQMRIERSEASGSARIKKAKVGTALLLAAALTACSGITDPYVTFGVDKNSKPLTVPQNPSFPEAKTIARHAVDNFQKRATSLEEFDVATGALMVGAGLAGVAIGLFDAGTDALYAAGLAGGAAGAGRAFLPLNVRKQAYLSGSSAINCAIVSIGMGEPDFLPSQPSSVAALRSGIGGNQPKGPLTAIADELLRVAFQNPAATASYGIAGAPPGTPNTVVDLLASSSALSGAANSELNPTIKAIMGLSAVQMTSAASTMTEGRDSAFQLATKIYSAAHTRGERLMNTTELIVNAVNKKIEAAGITPDASLEAAKKAIGAFKEDLKVAAEALKGTAEDGVSDAKASKVNLMAVAALGNKSGISDARTRESIEVAAKEEAAAKVLKSQAENVLEILKVSDSCLDGLK